MKQAIEQPMYTTFTLMRINRKSVWESMPLRAIAARLGALGGGEIKNGNLTTFLELNTPRMNIAQSEPRTNEFMTEHLNCRCSIQAATRRRPERWRVAIWMTKFKASP